MTPSIRKRLRNLLVTGTVMVAMLGLNLGPVSAHNNTAPDSQYDDGYGSFVATSYANTEFCADYSNYEATLEFPNDGASAIVKSSLPDHEDYIWGEFADGTYDTDGPNAPCPGSDTDHGGGGQNIEGFHGTLTTAQGVCTLGNGTYTRGHIEGPYPELNIVYTGEVIDDGCGKTGTVVFKTTIVYTEAVPPIPPFFSPYTTACNSPIAPQTCELGPATF